MNRQLTLYFSPGEVILIPREGKYVLDFLDGMRLGQKLQEIIDDNEDEKVYDSI